MTSYLSVFIELFICLFYFNLLSLVLFNFFRFVKMNGKFTQRFASKHVWFVIS